MEAKVLSAVEVDAMANAPLRYGGVSANNTDG